MNAAVVLRCNPGKLGLAMGRSITPAGAEIPRVALVGCGAVSEIFHAPALARLAAAGWLHVTAVVDPDPAPREALGRQFPEAARLRDLADLGETDLAIVASPPAAHAAQTIALLERRVHVLCEKPLATDMSAAADMVSLAERTGRVLAAGLVRHFYRSACAVRRIVRSKVLGRPVRAVVAEGHRSAWPLRSDAMFRKDVGGGGVFADLGSHAIELLQWWLGSPSEPRYEDDAMGGTEANCRLRLYFGAVPAEIVLSRAQSLENVYLLQFDNGWLRWSPSDPGGLWLECLGDVGGRLEFAAPDPMHAAVTIERAFDAQIMDVIAAIRDARQPRVPGRDTLACIELIERCYAERTLMPLPWLTPEEFEAVRRLA